MILLSVVLIVIIAILAIYVAAVYNGLIVNKNRVKEAFSDVQIQLKRRYDLIPNLVETVKGYAAHESQTLEKVIQARNMAMAQKGDLKEQANKEKTSIKTEENSNELQNSDKSSKE